MVGEGFTWDLSIKCHLISLSLTSLCLAMLAPRTHLSAERVSARWGVERLRLAIFVLCADAAWCGGTRPIHLRVAGSAGDCCVSTPPSASEDGYWTWGYVLLWCAHPANTSGDQQRCDESRRSQQEAAWWAVLAPAAWIWPHHLMLAHRISRTAWWQLAGHMPAMCRGRSS